MSRRPQPPPPSVQNVGTYLFTDAQLTDLTDARKSQLTAAGINPKTKHFKLKEVDTNTDIWKTLDDDTVESLLNPPANYDPEYTKKAMTIILTALAALSRKPC